MWSIVVVLTLSTFIHVSPSGYEQRTIDEVWLTGGYSSLAQCTAALSKGSTQRAAASGVTQRIAERTPTERHVLVKIETAMKCEELVSRDPPVKKN